MFALSGTSTRPNAAHEQHARAVVLFQVIDIRLETCGIRAANMSTRTCLSRHHDAGWLVAAGTEWARNRNRRGHRSRRLHDLCCCFRESCCGSRHSRRDSFRGYCSKTEWHHQTLRKQNCGIEIKTTHRLQDHFRGQLQICSAHCRSRVCNFLSADCRSYGHRPHGRASPGHRGRGVRFPSTRSGRVKSCAAAIIVADNCC